MAPSETKKAARKLQDGPCVAQDGFQDGLESAKKKPRANFKMASKLPSMGPLSGVHKKASRKLQDGPHSRPGWAPTRPPSSPGRRQESFKMAAKLHRVGPRPAFTGPKATSRKLQDGP